MTLSDAVSRDSEILGGTLCFAGTRVPVRTLFDYLEGGHDIEYFLEGYDWVKREQVLTVLEHSAQSLESTDLPIRNAS